MSPATAAGWTVRAEVAESKGNLGGAESAYRKAIEVAISPSEQMTTRANLLQFLTRFSRLDDRLAAELEQQVDSSGASDPLRAAALHCLGIFYVRAGYFERGQAWLSRAVALATSGSGIAAEDRWRIQNSRALALLAEGKAKAAGAILETLLDEPRLPSEMRLVLRANHAASLAAAGQRELAMERMGAVLSHVDEGLSIEVRWQIHELAAEVFDACRARKQAKRVKAAVAGLRQQVYRDLGAAHQVDYRSLLTAPAPR